MQPDSDGRFGFRSAKDLGAQMNYGKRGHIDVTAERIDSLSYLAPNNDFYIKVFGQKPFVCWVGPISSSFLPKP